MAEDNNDAAEPDIDPICIETALKKQVRRNKEFGLLFFWLAASLLMLGIRLNLVLGGLITFLIDYDVLLPVGILVGFICAVALGLLHVATYIKQKKRINLLMERKGQTVVKPNNLLKGCLLIIIIISILMVNIQLVMKNQMEIIPLDEYTVKFDLPLMEQVSPQEWYAAEASQEKYGSDDIIDCFVTEESRYVAPVMLYIRQYGEKVKDGTDTYGERFGYNVNYYEMRNEDLAVRYEKELCRNLSSGEMTAIHVTALTVHHIFRTEK